MAGDYMKLALSFSQKADSAAAALEIAATGSGEFHVGAVSLMPGDNVQGSGRIRLRLLKEHHSGMWRPPGGNFLSNWDWHDAIGDVDKRRPMFDDAWNAMQMNDIGMDEFMTMCRLIDVEPYGRASWRRAGERSMASPSTGTRGRGGTSILRRRRRCGRARPIAIARLL